MTNTKIAIIRPDGNQQLSDYYNSQEIGLAKGLSKLGVSVDVYVSGIGKEIKVNKLNGRFPGVVQIIEMPFYTVPEISHAIFPQLLNQIGNNNYNLVQVNEENELTSYIVARFCAKKSIPVIVYQGMYRPLTGRVRAAFQSLYNITLRSGLQKNISIAITKTTSARKYLENSGYGNVKVLPVGLDSDSFVEPEDINLCKKYNIPENHKLLVYVGVFETRRNIHFLVDIALKIKDKPITLVLVGDGELYDEIMGRIKKLNMNNVKLVGRVLQKQLPSFYEAASLFLLASDYEIYGMVILEAMYFGTPVLATKTAGSMDLIQSDVNGFLFDALSVDRWAEKIEEYLNCARLETLSENASRMVKEHYTWDIVAKKYCNEIIYRYARIDC